METEVKAPIGHIKSMTVKLDKPKMDIDNMEFRALSVFVGTNGSGKSLILKLSWFLGMIGTIYMKAFRRMIKPQLIEAAQFALNGGFKFPDFTGVVAAEYGGGVEIRVELLDGKVTDVMMTGFEEIVDFQPTRFLSSEMRLFNDISHYLKARKKLTTKLQLEQSDLMSLMEDYRLYDILHIEQMINSSPIKYRDEVIEMFKGSYDFQEDMVSLNIDLEGCDFYFELEDGSRKYMTTYGAGHQSIVNMMSIG